MRANGTRDADRERVRWRLPCANLIERNRVRQAPVCGRAWGLEPQSRLSCQAILAQENVTIEIPKYTINHAKENH